MYWFTLSGQQHYWRLTGDDDLKDLRLLHRRHCFHTAWGSLQQNSICVWYCVSFHLLSPYKTTTQESLVLIFFSSSNFYSSSTLDWSFNHHTWLTNLNYFEIQTQSVPDNCSCAAQTFENNYFSGAGVDLWNPNYVAAPGTCVFVCVPVCREVWVSFASVRVHSGFVTFTAAACGDKAKKSVEWGGRPRSASYWILEDGGWGGDSFTSSCL